MRIFLEIPHESPPNVWYCYTDKEFVHVAYETESMIYHEWTIDDALETWGELDDVPSELLEALEESDKVIEYGYANQTWYESKDEAPCEVEVAWDAHSHDLVRFIELSETGAKRFAETGDIYSGHKDIEARQAMRNFVKHNLVEE